MEVRAVEASHSDIIRYSFFFIGLICFGLGVAFSVKVKYLGLHPWDVLNVALF